MIEVDGKESVLSAKELVHHNQVESFVPYRGPKEQHPDGSERQEERLERRQEQRHALIKRHKVAKLGSLSVGDWEPDKQLVVVRNQKGKFWHTMGYQLNGHKYLYPEEGLFLLEVGSMDLRYGGVPLSLQQAYSLLIPAYFSKEHYKVYCHLMRLGYITTRHIEADVTDYEYRLRMHQYRHTQKLAYKKVQGWFQQLGDEPMSTIRPDSDSSPSVPSPTSHKGKRRYRLCASQSLSLTNSRNSNEQSGDSSEMGSAGEMTRATTARRRTQKALKQAAKKSQESITPPEPEKLPTPDGSDVMLKDEKSDESSEYSDGPVYVDEKMPTQGSVFDETSINLLSFHKRRLNASSEEGSNRKRQKLQGGETDSSGGERSIVSRGLKGDAHQRSEVLDDSGKGTPPVNVEPEPMQISYPQGHRDSSVGKNVAYGMMAEQTPNTVITTEQLSKGNSWQLPNRPDRKCDESPSSDLGLSDAASSTSVDLEEFLDMVIPMLTWAPKDTGISSQEPNSEQDYPQWNFNKILLPNIACSVKPHHMPFPAKELVPASIAASRCVSDLSNPEGNQARLNKLFTNSKLLLAKSRKIINVLEHIGDSKNQSSKTATKGSNKEPDNWKDYKLTRQQEEQNMTELMNSPVSHLWKDEVKPLVKPSDTKSTGHVLQKLQVIDGANLTSEHSRFRFSPPLDESKITFDVFLPDKNYKKSNPGQPNFCVVVCREDDPIPELATQLDLIIKADPTPLVWGIVDNADVDFFALNDIDLPVDITMG